MTAKRDTSAITCEVRRARVMDKWACTVLHCGEPIECKHFPTWADAYRYARETVRKR